MLCYIFYLVVGRQILISQNCFDLIFFLSLLVPKMQSLPTHLLNQVRDADSFQVPHRGQTAQVSPLLQDVRQRLLPVPALAHSPGDQTLPLLLLRELVPSAVTPAAAYQVGQTVNTKREKSSWSQLPPLLPISNLNGDQTCRPLYCYICFLLAGTLFMFYI